VQATLGSESYGRETDFMTDGGSLSSIDDISEALYAVQDSPTSFAGRRLFTSNLLFQSSFFSNANLEVFSSELQSRATDTVLPEEHIVCSELSSLTSPPQSPQVAGEIPTESVTTKLLSPEDTASIDGTHSIYCYI
jgi:hypothetical protein